MIKGRSNQNPPYEFITNKKWGSLGTTITLKKALDMWWNSVRIRHKDGIALCYKCCDGEYVIERIGKMSDKAMLAMEITLDDEYTEDGDGYPIVFATIAA